MGGRFLIKQVSLGNAVEHRPENYPTQGERAGVFLCQLSWPAAGAAPRGINSLYLWPATGHECGQNWLQGLWTALWQGAVVPRAGRGQGAGRAWWHLNSGFSQPWPLLLFFRLHQPIVQMGARCCPGLLFSTILDTPCVRCIC